MSFDMDRRNALTEIPNKWFASLKDKVAGKEPGSETVVNQLPTEQEKHCPGCGVMLPENAKFCLRCRAKMLDYAPKSVASARKERLCDDCGSAISLGRKTCVWCGAKREVDSPSAPETWEGASRTASSTDGYVMFGELRDPDMPLVYRHWARFSRIFPRFWPFFAQVTMGSCMWHIRMNSQNGLRRSADA